MGTHGMYAIVIPNWQPTTLNQLMGGHYMHAHKLKKSDAEMIGGYARLARVPKAEGKRRVTLTITLVKRQRAGDPDCYWKSTLDGLVLAGMLRDDNRQNCELAPVGVARGEKRETTI